VDAFGQFASSVCFAVIVADAPKFARTIGFAPLCALPFVTGACVNVANGITGDALLSACAAWHKVRPKISSIPDLAAP
jgi:hypothetical protein